ncbi:PH domain-containing protein [Cellulosimicrobium arenosum]|uniref:PH domain-containing protein n=1 Tax=Cellulosimicrobium arenosum TaxID=2708133 RepID=A0A927IYR2_9MICO|nr:PH domain-containing protein [Cellulosimicrobium arenosum]MBD8077845.1 PH domain-containing protein [Cellulosimicrobium arenosum]
MSSTSASGPAARGDRHDDLSRVFRPRFGAGAAWGTGAVVVGGCVVVWFTATGPLGSDWVNRLSLVVFALFTVWLLWRLGGVHAVPSPTGLRVRNVIYTRELDWAEIVSVRFGSGDAWVRLDLADGSTLAVMGVQRADGPRGEAEAQRLAALVQVYGEAPEEHRP